jgi:YVTN family beta-propeller protein
VTNTVYVTMQTVIAVINANKINGVYPPVAYVSSDNPNNWANVAVDPVANKIYANNYGRNSVSVIDGATNYLTDIPMPTPNDGPNALAVNPVTDKIYVTGAYGSNVTVIDGASYPDITVNDSNANTPTAIAVNPVTNTAYVANYDSNNVTVINGTTYSTSVGTDTNPTALAVNPVTNTIYVANFSDSDVTVIDGATNTAAATVIDPNAANPTAVAVNPVTNTIYVTNSGSNNVTVINGDTNSTATATDPNAINPTAVAVNPVTNTTYVANYDSNNVTVIDGATNTVTATVGVGLNPWDLAVNPVTDMIYVTNNASNDVSVIAGATNTVVATVTDPDGSGPTALDLNPLTNMIYVVDSGSSSMTVINGADNSFTSLYDPNGNLPYEVAVNPVTNKIYVPNSATSVDDGIENALTVIDGATNTISDVNIPTAYANPVAVAVNPVTNTVYVADSGGEVGTDEVIPEQQVQAIPILTSITALAGNQTALLTPAFSFTASNSFTLAPIDNLLFQVDTWQAPWVVGTSQGSGNFTGTTSALLPGFHILYAYSTDGEEGSSTNTGPQQTSPLIGNITAYPFLVAAPEASLSTGSLVFTGQAVGTSSTQQTVTLTNTGTAPLTVTGISLGGTNPGDFIESDNCIASSPIAHAGTCTVNLTLTPTTVGAKAATLTVTDNSGDVPGSQQTTSLAGTGIQATTTTTVISTSNPSVFGQAATFIATVTPQALGTPTGTVTFNDGTAAICNAVALSSDKAQCTIASLTVATHSISAAYIGDSSFIASSGTISQTVTQASTTTKITATAPTSIVLGQPLTVSYTVTVNAPGVGTIPGADTVTVTDSTGANCTGTVTAGHCALTPKAVGADTLTATFAGDTNYSSSVGSASASLAIAPNVTLTGLTATTLPDQSTSVGVGLAIPASTQLSGTLTLSFASSSLLKNSLSLNRCTDAAHRLL